MKNYIFGLFLFTLASCANNNTHNTTGTDSLNTTAVASVPAGIELENAAEQKIYDGYISLKNYLVEKKATEAAAAAAELSTSLKARKGCETTAVIADKIAASKDAAAQRKEFVALSADVIALFKHASLKQGTIYVQHCPMANDGNGADWLASENKIQNPYYGDEMMECGAVVEEIKNTK